MCRLTPIVALVLVSGCKDEKPGAPPAATADVAEAERKRAAQAALDAENTAPPPPRPPAKPSKFQAEVDLTFTGALEKKFTGPVGICGATFIDGRLQGGNYGIKTDELEFQIMALTDDELSKPGAWLNIAGPDRKSFVLRREPSKITIDVVKGATFDVELKSIAGAETVKVTGTVTCGPDYRRR
ncbi:MAG: hypothetical protein M3680_06925 [Myxococcota bacterium]|nr:hypothetical protein [Myxococcota bacterium]